MELADARSGHEAAKEALGYARIERLVHEVVADCRHLTERMERDGRATNSDGTDSEGQFGVNEGDTLTILTQLTMNGRLHKYGAGTLALGVVTVPTSIATTVRDMLSITKPTMTKCKLFIDLLPDGDETTITATFKTVGAMMVIR